MLQLLYRCALRLHPPKFRKRFADEMLSIFDHTRGRWPRLLLLLDSVVSFTRQWSVRSEWWNDVSTESARQLAAEGVPSFSSLDSFRPSTAAMIHGVVLATSLFILTCFAIRYSRIRVLHIRVPALEFANPIPSHSAASPSSLRGTPTPAPPTNEQKADSSRSDGLSDHLYVEPLPVEAEELVPTETVVNSKSTLRSELAGTPVAVLRTLEINLRLYTGMYASHSSRTTIIVRIRGDQLVIKVGGELERTISPISKTTFTVNGSSNTEVEFGSESNGKFHRLRLSNAGTQIVAERQ